MCDKAILKIYGALKFVPVCYKNQEIFQINKYKINVKQLIITLIHS